MAGRSSCFTTRSGSPTPVRRFADESRRRGQAGRPRAGGDELRSARRRAPRLHARPGDWAAPRDAGVGLSRTVHPTILRAVTHLDISDKDVETAIEAIPIALRVLTAA